MKNYKKILSLFLVGIISTSCLVDDEISAADGLAANTPLVVGFNKTSASFSYFEDLGPINNSINVEVIGGGPIGVSTTTRTVNFEIDPSSTAVAGTEFSFPEGNSVVIPANRDLASLPIIVNSGNLDPTAATFVKLNIISENDVVASQTKGSITISFVGCISQIQEGAYNWSRVGGDAGVTSGASPFTLTATNEYDFYFPALSAGGQPLAVTIGDVCGSLTILGSELEDYGYEVLADDITIDPNTNTIVFVNLIATNGATTFDRGTVTYILN